MSPLRRGAQPSARHRKPEEPENNFKYYALAAIGVVAAIALLAGAWFGVSMLIRPTAVQAVPYIPTESFEPAAPGFSITPAAPPTNIDKECSNFFDHEDAQKYYVAQGGPSRDPDDLDLDNDGTACENYVYTSSTSSAVVTPTGEPNDK